MSETVSPFLAFIPTPGDYPCNDCGEALVSMPGVCEACDNRRSARAHDRSMRTARESVPEIFRWARSSHPEWRKRVHENVHRQLLGLGPALPRALAFVGPAGSGKSSAACAMLNVLHERAAWNAPADQVERARRAYFVSVPELLEAANDRRGEIDQEPVRLARSATVLVLDDLRPGRPNDAIDTLLFSRFNRDQPTIVTTWMSKAECSRHYGEGFARRAYERVIEC